MENMYDSLAKYTDAFYAAEDYKSDIDFIIQQAKKYKISGKTVIDVACGSGNHSKLLSKQGFKVYGVDLNKGMLNLAKKNVPKITLYQQDLRKLELPINADILICMFNSINYCYGYKEMESTFKRFYDHLNEKGLIVFNTGLSKHWWKNGYFGAAKIQTKSFDVARINKSFLKGDYGVTDIVYVVFEGSKKKIYESQNKIFLPELDHIKKLMLKVGFKTSVKKVGSSYMFIGVK